MKFFKWELDYLKRLQKESNELLLKSGLSQEEINYGNEINKEDLKMQELDLLKRFRYLHNSYNFKYLFI